ncbi:Uncharacterised protein [Klebsiella quasipneumoniae]|nr:Uncharacterised protein [Klebsiella quasipneumoniae]
MNSQQLGQQPIFIWMCYGIFETDLYAETFFCRQKSVSPTDGHFVALLNKSDFG